MLFDTNGLAQIEKNAYEDIKHRLIDGKKLTPFDCDQVNQLFQRQLRYHTGYYGLTGTIKPVGKVMYDWETGDVEVSVKWGVA